MSSPRQSLVYRTLVHVAIFAAGSVAFVGLMSVLLVTITRAVLPSRDEPSEASAETEDMEPPRGKAQASAARPKPAPKPKPSPAPKPEPEPEREEAPPPPPPVETRPPEPEKERWARCCDALDQIAASAPAEDQIIYKSATAICRGLKGDAPGRQVIRNMLKDHSPPPECE